LKLSFKLHRADFRAEQIFYNRGPHFSHILEFALFHLLT